MIRSLEAEMGVISSMLIDNRAVGIMARMLKPEDFSRHAHQVLFGACLKLGSKLDYLTLRSEIGNRLEELGGEEYLEQVVLYVPSAANAEHYAEIVREKSERRGAIEAAQRLLSAAPEMPIEELRAMRSEIGNLDYSPVPFVDFASVAIRTRRTRGVTTGFGSLDGAISTGGYPAGQMTVASGYHKSGKTSFMLSSFVAQLETGTRSLFATFADLGKEDLKERMVRSMCGWGHEPQGLMEQGEFMRAVKAIEFDFESFCYDASKVDTGDDVETFVAWFKAEHSKKPFDCVFMDYAQKIVSSDKRAMHSELAQSATVSRKLSRLAANTGVPIVVGSQVTEGSVKEGRKAITKGSRVWEEDCGWCLRVTPERNIEVAYSRFGRQGFEVPMTWNDTHLRFEDGALQS